MQNMPIGLTIVMYEYFKRQKKAGESQASSNPHDNVWHTGKGEGVYCHMVKTNH